MTHPASLYDETDLASSFCVNIKTCKTCNKDNTLLIYSLDWYLVTGFVIEFFHFHDFFRDLFRTLGFPVPFKIFY